MMISDHHIPQKIANHHMVGEIPIFLSGLLYITTKNIEGVIHHSSEAL